MSIDQSKVIDFVGVVEDSNEVILTISDHLDWEDSKNQHLLLLQDKLNDYLAFIEGGDLLRKYPAAKGRQPVIEVHAKYPLNDMAKHFYDKATKAIKDAGFELRFKLH